MISVIVATYNRREVLGRCLQALAEQDFPASEYEIIVVVDGSTDGTQEFLRTLEIAPTLRVIDQPNRGLAAARNAGLRAAAHAIVLFLDDDLLCEPGTLSAHAKAHESGEHIVAFGPVLIGATSADGAASRLTRAHYSEQIYGPLARGEQPTWPIHARVPPNSSIGRELLLSFGGFDEQFVNAHEDIELGIRLWSAGVKFVYVPGADAEHVYVKSDRDFGGAEAVRGGKYEVMLCRKHPVYRELSVLATAQRGRLFRDGKGDLLLKRAAMRGAARGALGIADKLGSASATQEERLLGLQGGLNFLRGAVLEAGSWDAFRNEFWMRLPVLMYHHIGWCKRGMYPGLSITPGHFSAQMHWLADNGYTPIASADWLAWCDAGTPLPAKPVLITFDDAYADLVKHALPVLARHSFHAVIFVPTAYVGKSNVWDQDNGRPALDLMSRDEIKAWTQRGVEFGAHSRTHPEMDHIRAGAVQEEVEGSRKDLEEICGAPVVAFAYPYGSYNSEVREIVARSFRFAVTTEEGINSLGTDLLQLRRTMVQPGDTLVDFGSRVRFGFSIPERMKTNLRRAVRRVIPARKVEPS